MTRKETEKQEAIDCLRELLPPGTTVYTIVRHVSASGTSRDIDCYVIEHGRPRWITWLVAKACDMRLAKNRESIRMGGCGMDMGFALVFSLSHALYRDSFDCIGKGCPSNDHSNGDRNYEPHRHSDGGYALRQAWL